MSTPEQQINLLTDKLSALELESRRILRALHWATKVRLILFFGLLLFVLVSAALFYLLFQDIKTNRITEVQRVIREQPEKFSEPLTRQIMLLAEEEGPNVADVFRKQAQEDSSLYVEAFDRERNALIKNLQTSLEEKLAISYATMLDEQEEMLIAEFPVLEDPEKLENIRNNMEKIYDKIGKRYFVDYLKDEMEELVVKIDSFPAVEPRMENIPVGEQIATEFLELVRMMIVNADNYVMPEKEVDETVSRDSTDDDTGNELPSSGQDDASSEEEDDAAIPAADEEEPSEDDGGND